MAVKPVVGLGALHKLYTGQYTLRTMEELDGMQFGPYSRRILNEVAINPIDAPVRAGAVAKRVGLTEKLTAQALDCMVSRKDPVFTKFKDPDVLKYSIRLAMQPQPRKTGWFNEGIADLGVAIDDLGVAIDELGNSPLAVRLEKIFSRYNKMPWNYVPLVKKNGVAIYGDMQLRTTLNI